MNAPTDPLAALGPGLSDPVFDAQAVFRAALDALAHPGRIVNLTEPASIPAPRAPATTAITPAAAALALALLDADTRVWIDAPLDGEALRAWLRFHTGCVFVSRPDQADFALLGSLAAAGDLDAFAAGDDEHPDRSTTLIVQVASLEARGPGAMRLRGPGIRSSATLAAAGADPGFVARWQARRALFPRGNDLFLARGARLAALPRGVDLDSLEAH